MEKIGFKDFKEGKTFNLGVTALSKEQIIEFAQRFDPLDFHVDEAAAKRSMFKGLVASGPHFFTKIHREQWIPRFGDSVLAGLEVNNWKFLKPVYAEQKISSLVTIKAIKENFEKKHAVVQWLYEFKDENGEHVQMLESTVLHKTF